ncbi:uncharacterized protein N7469_002112 [Penicillium citrinum]|uniref:Reverse transcriptase n=1 Tax=Penicillium citrinum TaxID=5077 RepID=A0A9W9PAL8_PENCI|nr:uncharacterized protein N7469_002112 [Penicillium citrinum]KAJ5240521.1 hypothetical protein N7469_002112 [Penicillium citrinum]
MDPVRLMALETIDPRPLPPWPIEQAKTVHSTSDIVVFSDASGRDGHLGAAAIALNNNGDVVESQQVQVGPMERWSVHVAELIGIFHAINIRTSEQEREIKRQPQQSSATAGQHYRQSRMQQRSQDNGLFTQSTKLLQRSKVQELRCVFNGCQGIAVTPAMTADRMAKEAARPGKSHSFRPLLTRERASIRSNIIAQWRQEWRLASKGGHLKKIDNSPPSIYTRKLIVRKPGQEPGILLRTGYNWLSTYAKLFGFREDDQCVCGAQETVTHVLVDCPWGGAFSSVLSLLGGSKQGEKGKPDTVSRAKTVQAVLDFAEASQGFRSRAPRGQPNSGSGN